MEKQTLQLQIFDQTSGSYVPLHSVRTNLVGNVRSLAERARSMGYKCWRICKPERSLTPRHVTPRGSGRFSTVADIQRNYVAWALDKGLTHITVYKNRQFVDQHLFKTVRVITMDEHFSIEHTEYPPPPPVAIPYQDVSHITEYGLTQRLSQPVRVF